METLEMNPTPMQEPQEGHWFLHLGKRIPVTLKIESSKEGSGIENGRLILVVPDADPATLASALRRFCFKECKRIIHGRVSFYQKHLKVRPRSILIEESYAKWGSCSSNRCLTFNWRLVSAPLEVVDYIVVHELCHLEHMNHDRSYWRRVGSILPHYKDVHWVAAPISSLFRNENG